MRVSIIIGLVAFGPAIGTAVLAGFGQRADERDRGAASIAIDPTELTRMAGPLPLQSSDAI